MLHTPFPIQSLMGFVCASSGHDGVLAFPRSPEPSLVAKIAKNKHRGGQGNQEEEGQWAGERPSTSVSLHRPQPARYAAGGWRHRDGVIRPCIQEGGGQTSPCVCRP